MISIPRTTARAVRAVARACVAGRPRGPAPPVVVRRLGGTLTLFARVDGVAVAFAAGPQAGPDETVVVSMAVLAASVSRLQARTGRPFRSAHSLSKPIRVERPAATSTAPTMFPSHIS